MKYVLINSNPMQVDAWREFFSKEESVSIIKGDIISLSIDAIVSPANSFGFMDGSLDHAISERVGWHLEKELQARIKASAERELLISQTMVLTTGDKNIPYLF